MKIIVYTANINNYDVVELPKFTELNRDVEFILFTTDLSFKSKVWQVRYVNDYKLIHKDSQRVARYFKLQPHKVLPPHDISIWFDCCLSLKISSYAKFAADNLLGRCLDMVSYRHPKRTCLYDEGAACMSQNLDNGITIKRQMNFYKKQGLPLNFGLFDTGFLIRRNTSKMVEFNDLWYKELKKGSKRDQLSHSYVLWQTGIKISSFTEGLKKGQSPYLKKRKHINFRGKKAKNKATKKEDISVAIMNKKIAYKMRNR